MTVPSTGKIGETWASFAVDKIIGVKMFAAAVLLTISVSQTAIVVPQTVSPNSLLAKGKLAMSSPIPFAKPVWKMASPSVNPPAKSKIVPQSIL